MYNLAILDNLEYNRISVDLAASAVAFKERHNMIVAIEQVEHEQPILLRSYFLARLAFYRKISLSLLRQSS